MAADSRTARGLRRVPKTAPPQRERPREEGPKPRQRRTRMKFQLFSLGQGLDMPLFVFIMVLLAVGLVMLFSASYADSYYRQGNSYYYISRQGIYALVGVAAMLLISTFDYHHFHKLVLPIAGITLAMLFAVVLFGRVLKIPSIAPPEGVAVRWLNIGPVQFQPSEIAKFAIILIFAHMISVSAAKMHTFRYGVLPFVGVLGLFGGLIALEHHMSGTLIILLLGAVMMFIGGTRPRWFILGGTAVAVALVCYLMFGGGYQTGRVIGWLDPFNAPEGVDTYQTRQSLYAIGSGGFLGLGLGQSRQKYLYLPAPQNDFIFAIICEELGMVGALAIMVLFGMLIWRGMYVSLKAKDRFGMLLGLGITFQVGIQAVLNICVVTNTIPNTGISLPFFSAGGTALLMLLGEMGILLNISRSASVEKT